MIGVGVASARIRLSTMDDAWTVHQLAHLEQSAGLVLLRWEMPSRSPTISKDNA